MPCWGIEPASAACRADALSTGLQPRPSVNVTSHFVLKQDKKKMKLSEPESKVSRVEEACKAIYSDTLKS